MRYGFERRRGEPESPAVNLRGIELIKVIFIKVGEVDFILKKFDSELSDIMGNYPLMKKYCNWDVCGWVPGCPLTIFAPLSL